MYARLALLGLFAACGISQAQTQDTLKIVGRLRIDDGGPLTMAQFRTIQTLPRDAEFGYFRQTWLRVMLGRPGTAKNTFQPVSYGCVRKRGPLRAEFKFKSKISGEKIATTQVLKTKG